MSIYVLSRRSYFYSKIRKSRYLDIRIFGNPEIRISGFPAIRKSGNPEIRIIRKSGFPDSKARIHKHGPYLMSQIDIEIGMHDWIIYCVSLHFSVAPSPGVHGLQVTIWSRWVEAPLVEDIHRCQHCLVRNRDANLQTHERQPTVRRFEICVMKSKLYLHMKSGWCLHVCTFHVSKCREGQAANQRKNVVIAMKGYDASAMYCEDLGVVQIGCRIRL